MKSEEMQPLVRLGHRLRKEAQSVGLDMQRFFVVPSLNDSTHDVHAVFFIDEEFEAASTESDEEFEKLIDAQGRLDAEAKVDEARERLKDMNERLRDPKRGILGD